MTDKRKRRWPRRLFWFFSTLLILAVAGRLGLPPAVVFLANAKLPAILGAGFHVDDVDFVLHRGFVHLRNGKIFHPKEFGAGVFIEVPEAWVTVRLSSLLRPPIVFEEIIAKNGIMNLIINPDGKINTCVFESKGPRPAATPAPRKTTTDLPSVVLEKATGMNITFSFTDRSAGKVPLFLRIAEVSARGTSVVIDGDEGPVKRYPPGCAEITGKLVQDPFPSGRIGVYCRGYPLMNSIPSFLATVQAAGVNLRTLNAILPDGTSKMLGGTIVDSSFDFSLSPAQLNCEVEVVSDRGTRSTLTVSGPPDKPTVNTSSALYGILVNSSGRMGNFVSRVTGTTLNTAQTLGQGTVGTVGNFGEGLFKTFKGIFTLSPKSFVEGIGQTTVGTVYTAGKTIYDTASSATSGVINVTGLNSSDQEFQVWLAAIPQRWQDAWAQARRRLDEQYWTKGK